MKRRIQNRLPVSWLEGVLTLLVVALVLLAAALFFFNISLVVFQTGSMAPAIPAGSVAVSRSTAAENLRVGDVVTVERPGQLPITHRIVSIERFPGSATTWSATLRGDANPTNDPFPYEISEAKKVLFSIPHSAQGVVILSHPVTLIVLCFLVSLIVIWALWPTGSSFDNPDAPRNRHSPHQRV